MENTHGIATKFHTGNSIIVAYYQMRFVSIPSTFHVVFHMVFHSKFHIPYTSPSYIKLGSMEWHGK